MLLKNVSNLISRLLPQNFDGQNGMKLLVTFPRNWLFFVPNLAAWILRAITHFRCHMIEADDHRERKASKKQHGHGMDDVSECS